MADKDINADGTYILDAPVLLPPVLDCLIVGGGPFGTAAAFRAKELGLAALVIDSDDLMRQIRDFPEGKIVDPGYGRGERMDFPEGDELIRSLGFEPMDKDEMWSRWKGLYRTFNVPAQVGVELTGLTWQDGVWDAAAWNAYTKREQRLRARHVVLGIGRGRPRPFDIPGNGDKLAYSLDDPKRYVGKPTCVIGGGTSAAEAVIEISRAKREAGDPSGVYWAYRGSRMDKVSKALADKFFDVFLEGNVWYLRNSEPAAFMESGGESVLWVQTSREVPDDQPAKLTHLEFLTRFSVACIGGEIDESLLKKVGAPMIKGGPSNTKHCVVTNLLESGQPNVYLAGDVLYRAYFQTTDFDADPSTFTEIRRQNNIKAALRDGVVVAGVIKQKLQGRRVIDVDVFGERSAASGGRAAAAEAPSDAKMPCALASLMPNGEALKQYPLKADGPTTIGRTNADIAIPRDDRLADVHAQLVPKGEAFEVEALNKQPVFVLPVSNREIAIPPGTRLRAGTQWIVVGSDATPAKLAHHDPSGRLVRDYPLIQGATMVGRNAPDITLATDDCSVSQRHFIVTLSGDQLSVRDLGGPNRTQIRVSGAMRVRDGDLILVGRQTFRFDDERAAVQPPRIVEIDTSTVRRPDIAGSGSAADAPPAGATQAQTGSAAPRPAAAPAATSPVVVLADGTSAPCDRDDSILDALEKNGFTIDAECLQGICGKDKVRILDGADALTQMGKTEKDTLKKVCKVEPGKYRLACMAKVRGLVKIETT